VLIGGLVDRKTLLVFKIREELTAGRRSVGGPRKEKKEQYEALICRPLHLLVD